MPDQGTLVLTPTGEWTLNSSDGSGEIVPSSTDCPPIDLLNCPGGTVSSGIGLRDVDNVDGAVAGDTVLYGGTCYILSACRRCDLTPTTGAASKKTGCDDEACGTSLPQLNPCCDGDLIYGLRPEDTPGGATLGRTVADLATGKCYVIGANASGLTPTSGMFSLIGTDCTSDDCPSDCCTVCPDNLPDTMVLSFHYKQFRFLHGGAVPACTDSGATCESDVQFLMTKTGSCAFGFDYQCTSIISDSGSCFASCADTDILNNTLGPPINFCEWLLHWDVVGPSSEVFRRYPQGSYPDATQTNPDPSDPTYDIKRCFSSAVAS